MTQLVPFCGPIDLLGKDQTKFYMAHGMMTVCNHITAHGCRLVFLFIGICVSTTMGVLRIIPTRLANSFPRRGKEISELWFNTQRSSECSCRPDFSKQASIPHCNDAALFLRVIHAGLLAAGLGE